MIKITALNKFYKSKRRSVCHALKNISLTLPDNGLVFVLGKSGSGKSTLLNLIGGLDNISSGSIEVDGNDLANFKEKDFCNYRNTHIGFIFQDYHLIDELTVYENILLSLNLRRIEDKDLVSAALAKVDLAGYENRYPTELSGGEQQRVAIARAIVKNPRIILADEPTGNLDTHTATTIVTLLKELSKDCLILIVSHNVNDANNYADRIIELSKGEIISDKSRNPEFKDEVTLENGELIYPDGLALKDKDINFINCNLRKIVKKTDKFLPTKEENNPTKKIKIENKSLSVRKELNLSGKFLKNKALAISLSSFMVAVIMVIMALAQTIINFDSSHIIAEEMSKSDLLTLLLNKTVDEKTSLNMATSYPVEIDHGDIQAFYDAGYNGTIYPVLNYSVMITTYGSSYGITSSRFTGPYITETFGTMIVDEDFIEEKFGNLTFLAKAEEQVPYGVYITDYVADSILAIHSKYKNKGYDDIVGSFYTACYSAARSYINGIIYTGYRDRYGEFIDKLPSSTSASELFESEEFQELSNEIYGLLGYSFTTNENFVESIKASSLSCYVPHYKMVFNGSLELVTNSHPYGIDSRRDTDYPSSSSLNVNWVYTTTPPEIPEGAKYMRVVFNDAVDDLHGIENEVTRLSHATLRFGKNEPISEDIMNFIVADGKNSVYLDEISGNVIYETFGGTGASGYTRTIVSDYIEIPSGMEITEFASITWKGYPFCAFYDEDKTVISTYSASQCDELPEKTIRMAMAKYNEVFGTNYTDATRHTFVPHKAIMSHHNYHDVDNSDPLFVEEVTIHLMESNRSRTFSLSADIYDLFLKDAYRVYGLYFDGTDGIGRVLDVSEELNYQPQSYAVEGIHSMTKAVDVFIPIFELISIFLYIGVIFILMNFSSKMINDKMHEIGILKALGTKNSSVAIVFGLQVMLIALLTCGMSTLGYFLFIDVANDVLIESVHRIAPSWTMPDLQFLTFKPTIAAMNCILIFILAGASLIFPMIKIKAIKPVKIIKAKE